MSHNHDPNRKKQEKDNHKRHEERSEINTWLSSDTVFYMHAEKGIINQATSRPLYPLYSYVLVMYTSNV